jgi:hypothetical protein
MEYNHTSDKKVVVLILGTLLLKAQIPRERKERSQFGLNILPSGTCRGTQSKILTTMSYSFTDFEGFTVLKRFILVTCKVQNMVL